MGSAKVLLIAYVIAISMSCCSPHDRQLKYPPIGTFDRALHVRFFRSVAHCFHSLPFNAVKMFAARAIGRSQSYSELRLKFYDRAHSAFEVLVGQSESTWLRHRGYVLTGIGLGG